MNVRNINAVLAALRARDPVVLVEAGTPIPVGFNMSLYCGPSSGLHDRTGSECETVACLAGWTVIVLEGKGCRRGAYFGRAMELLGLSSDQACDLFEPHEALGKFNALHDEAFDFGAIPIDIAADALQSVRDTGVVTWNFEGMLR